MKLLPLAHTSICGPAQPFQAMALSRDLHPCSAYSPGPLFKRQIQAPKQSMHKLKNRITLVSTILSITLSPKEFRTAIEIVSLQTSIPKPFVPSMEECFCLRQDSKRSRLIQEASA